MRILNLFAGKYGGNRSLWENHQITAIENNPESAKHYKKLFPEDNVLVMNVMDHLRKRIIDLDQYDLIWASPPCQRNSQMMKFYLNKTLRKPLPNLDETVGLYFWLKSEYNGLIVIENVQPWFKWIAQPVQVKRHLFWANFPITPIRKNDNKWKHGRIGGIMRTKAKNSPDKRNTVDSWIGEYILNEAIRSLTKKGLSAFL